MNTSRPGGHGRSASPSSNVGPVSPVSMGSGSWIAALMRQSDAEIETIVAQSDPGVADARIGSRHLSHCQ